MTRMTLTLFVLSFVPTTIRHATQCPGWKPGFNTPGTTGAPRVMLVHDDGSGRALFVGGFFSHAGSVSVQNIVKWDGSSWHALASGIAGLVLALATHDDGTIDTEPGTSPPHSPRASPC
jgi:hypothetical protein